VTLKRLLNPDKALRTLRKTPFLLETLLRGMSPQDAARLRDGADGWSIVYILCHMRDEEDIFAQRVRDLLAKPRPTFGYALNDELAVKNRYDAADYPAVLDDFMARRRAFIALLETVTDDQWLLEGEHPLQGPATLLDVALNVGLHDVDHMEQIARCLAGAR
jgi:hypothetical protein